MYLVSLLQFQHILLTLRGNDEFQQLWIWKGEYHKAQQPEVSNANNYAVQQPKEYDGSR